MKQEAVFKRKASGGLNWHSSIIICKQFKAKTLESVALVSFKQKLKGVFPGNASWFTSTETVKVVCEFVNEYLFLMLWLIAISDDAETEIEVIKLLEQYVKCFVEILK